MMRNKILLVHQDCPDCESREMWYKEQQKIAKANKIKIVPTPYNTPGVKNIILSAQESGMERTLLFYTDGKKFGYDISDFITVKRKTKKAEEGSETNTKD